MTDSAPATHGQAAPPDPPALAAPMLRGGKPLALTPGERGLLCNLEKAGLEVRQLERHLKAARNRRAVLILKAVRAKFSTREIGRLARCSSPAVSQIAAREAEIMKRNR